MHRSRVPLLVLANLSLLPVAACKQGDVQPEDPTIALPATATATASATAPATASATASATATASASASADPADTCEVNKDCGAAYKECVHLAGSTKGHCETRKNYHLGRPLVAGGEVHLAPYASAPALSSDEVLALMDAAREEHASIAAFARTISELMALGAPTWLLSKTQSALGDEIRHTDGALDLVERATGERPVLGRLEAAVAPLRGADAAGELFRDVFRGGAVGETVAAARAEQQRDAAETDEVRAFHEMIVRDEARHAALAFETLRWLLAERPELREILAEEEARFAAKEPFETRALVGPLLGVLH